MSYKFEDNTVYLSGDLDFITTVGIHKKFKQQIKSISNQSIEVNFSSIENYNSAGLGMIVEWVKLAKLNNTKLTITALPEGLKLLAKTTEIYNILPVK